MEKLLYLINYLAKESKINIGELPSSEIELKNLFRSLMNMRPPNDISEDYLKVEDEFLQEELDKKVVAYIKSLSKEELRQTLYEVLYDGADWVFERFVREHIDY